MSQRPTIVTLGAPPRFDLAAAVSTYGFYLLAPNDWDSACATLRRPLLLENGATVRVAITHRGERIHVRCDRPVARDLQPGVRAAVRRMLRLDEDFAAFHRVHKTARHRRFGRLFRSPTLFEDIVKTITCCNVTWSNTINMNRLLCEHHGDGGFPSARALAGLRPATLKRTCRVGYRAQSIIQLARAVRDGHCDLDRLERSNESTADLHKALRTIHGVGDYAASNLCMLLGRYDRIAIDSEVYRHFRESHGWPTPRAAAALRRHDRRIAAHYARFAPYQFLAYWFELWYRYPSGGDS